MSAKVAISADQTTSPGLDPSNVGNLPSSEIALGALDTMAPPGDKPRKVKKIVKKKKSYKSPMKSPPRYDEVVC